MRATWNGTVIAESDETIVVEGNHYFPPQSVRWDHLEDSTLTTRCPWKGTARYWSVEAGGRRSDDAAWCYPAPKAAAAEITGYVAFWRGVQVRP
jgi:uncharacterized protein (DUF427 family)